MKPPDKVIAAIVVAVVALPLLLIMAGLVIDLIGWGPFLVISAVAIIIPLWMFIARTRQSLAQSLNGCHEAWLAIDAELKRRHDLVSRLMSTTGGRVAQETQAVGRVNLTVNAARASHGPPASRARDESALVSALRQFLSVADGYPDLKADGDFLRLQQKLMSAELAIQSAEKLYNSNVQDYNDRLQSFPSAPVAQAFGFKPREYFNVEPAVHTPMPEVQPSGQSRQQATPAPGDASPETAERLLLVQTRTGEPAAASPYSVEATVGSRKVTRRTSRPAWPGWPSGFAGPNAPSS